MSAKAVSAARTNSGFTLIELLVVLTIIGLISAVVAPQFLGKSDRAKLQAASVQAKALRAAVETFKLDVGRYPNMTEGLDALVKPPQEAIDAARWRGPYLADDLPLDPWNQPYQFSIPGARGQPFALYSFGPDKKRGGDGDNADIGTLPPEQ